MICLYGVDKGNSSWPRVTLGVKQGLQAAKKLRGFYDVGRVDDDLDNAMAVGFDASVGICVGPPNSAGVMVGRGNHEHRLLMIATNSTWLPDGTMERVCDIVTAFIGTSVWASSVIEKYAQGKPVYTWPHGVDAGFRPYEWLTGGRLLALGSAKPLRALHLASTHLQRKGTKELIFGWAMAMREGDLRGKLHLVADGPRGYFLAAIHDASKGDTAVADSIELMPRMDLSVDDMREFYWKYNLVCQPSRAEGFGMCINEARVCGIPILATACTGHADHLRLGDAGTVIVAHGEDARVDDGPGAMAPTVHPSDIADALCYAFKHRESLALAAWESALAVGKKWSWPAVTQRFLAKWGPEIGL